MPDAEPRLHRPAPRRVVRSRRREVRPVPARRTRAADRRSRRAAAARRCSTSDAAPARPLRLLVERGLSRAGHRGGSEDGRGGAHARHRRRGVAFEDWAACGPQLRPAHRAGRRGIGWTRPAACRRRRRCCAPAARWRCSGTRRAGPGRPGRARRGVSRTRARVAADGRRPTAGPPARRAVRGSGCFETVDAGTMPGSATSRAANGSGCAARTVITCCCPRRGARLVADVVAVIDAHGGGLTAQYSTYARLRPRDRARDWHDRLG